MDKNKLYLILGDKKDAFITSFFNSIADFSKSFVGNVFELDILNIKDKLTKSEILQMKKGIEELNYSVYAIFSPCDTKYSFAVDNGFKKLHLIHNKKFVFWKDFLKKCNFNGNFINKKGEMKIACQNCEKTTTDNKQEVEVELVSDCCEVKSKVCRSHSDFISNNYRRAMYNVCTKCGKICDQKVIIKNQ